MPDENAATPSPVAPRLTIDGCSINGFDWSATKSWLGARQAGHCITLNLQHFRLLRESGRYRQAFRQADLITLDGQPLVWLARCVGVSTAQRVTGADLLSAVADWSRDEGVRIGLLGGFADVTANAATRLSENFPGCSVSAFPLPYSDDIEELADEAQRVLSHLDNLKYIFVLLGAPKQEVLIRELLNRGALHVFIGAGAAAELYVTDRSRAPRAIQRAGFEWVWRACREPRRLLPRYARDAMAFARYAPGTVREHRRSVKT